MKKVGRYVIISELGRGAMGIVYKASDPTIDREVALKVLSLNASQEEGTNSPQEMFMREVRAAGRLAHPSIVTIYDAFDDQENQTSCIVMELVPGVTLEKILGSGATLTTAQSLSIIGQVVEALDYAHRNKVIHRDLKPANILVTDDGRAKITDFGIAKVLAREGVARTIGIMGTPSYMSPEQVKGGDIDARTDIFSLGIMIFTMLTGTKPFSGNTVAVMFKIVYEEPQLPSSLNPQLTPDHDYLIKKCLEKDRNQRYSSARELLNDLDDLEHGRPLRSQAVAPAPVPPSPAPAPHPERTLTLPIPGLAKPTPQQPAPPTPSAAPPPRVAAQPPRPQAPRAVSAPPASPPVTAPPAKPVIPSPVKPVPASDARPLLGKTLSMRVPDLSAVSTPSPASPHAPPAPPIPPDFSRMESTLPMERPDLSDVSPQTPGPPDAAPAPPASPDFSRLERTVQMPDPEAYYSVSGRRITLGYSRTAPCIRCRARQRARGIGHSGDAPAPIEVYPRHVGRRGGRPVGGRRGLLEVSPCKTRARGDPAGGDTNAASGSPSGFRTRGISNSTPGCAGRAANATRERSPRGCKKDRRTQVEADNRATAACPRAGATTIPTTACHRNAFS